MLLPPAKLLTILHRVSQNPPPPSPNGVSSATGISDNAAARQFGRKEKNLNVTRLQEEMTRTESLCRGSHHPSWEAETLSQGAKQYSVRVASRATHQQAGNQTSDYSSYLLEHTKGAIHSRFEEA